MKKHSTEATVEGILSSAAELFSTKGFDRTSMQDLVSAAGISKGAIYHHFKSKEEIVEAVMRQQSAALEAQFADWMKETENCTARDRLVKILEMNLKEQESSALHTSLLLQAKSPEFIVQHMKACIEISAPIFADILRDGISDGSITSEDPDEVSELFFLLINVWCDPSILACDLMRLERRLRCLKKTMQNLGADIVTDELMMGMIRLFEKLYLLQK